MKIYEKEGKIYANRESLKNWDKNPRNISNLDFSRLKLQIKKLGQYKPLLVTEEGIILGGNMRYRAYKDLGIQEVWVSVVKPKSEAEKVEFALSDNDRAGYYDEQMLQELIWTTEDLSTEVLGLYKVDMQEAKMLSEVIQDKDFDPATLEEQGNLDEKDKQKCPSCGFEY